MRRIIADFYGPELPATSYIPSRRAAAGCWGSRPWAWARQGRGEISRLSEQLVIARHNGIAWVHCAEVVPQNPAAGVHDAAASAFGQVRRLLDGAGVRFDQVIRTWLYLGGITEHDGPCARDQELNRARDDSFEDVRLLAGRRPPDGGGPAYPASTGIGTRGRGLENQCDRIGDRAQRRDCRAAGDPAPTAAYDYSASYSPNSPKFSRAMAPFCAPTRRSSFPAPPASPTRRPATAATCFRRRTRPWTTSPRRSPRRTFAATDRRDWAFPGGWGWPASTSSDNRTTRRSCAVCRGAVGRVADDGCRGRRLPPGSVGGDRRHRLFVQVRDAVPRTSRPAFSPDAAGAHPAAGTVLAGLEWPPSLQTGAFSPAETF